MKKINVSQKLLIFYYLLCFTTVISFNSCKKDLHSEQKKINNAELQEIKTWYSSIVKNRSDNLFESMTPNYNSIFVNDLPNQTVIEIDLNNPNNIFQSTESADKGNMANNLSRNNIKLLVFKDKSTNLISYGCYMSIINESEIIDLRTIHYNKKNGLTGRIFYYNTDGTFENGWVFQGGLIKKFNSKSNEAEYKEYLKLKIQLLSSIGGSAKKISRYEADFCTTEATPSYQYQCIGAGEGPPYCTKVFIGYFYSSTCNGGGGNGDYSPPIQGGGVYGKTPFIEIKKDSLTFKFPCVTKLVINKLEKIPLYNKMVEPFLAEGMKPNLTWKTNTQVWDGKDFSGATTGYSQDSNTGMSSDINLNSKMLQNGSILLVAAVAIHETYHAYVNYMFAMKQLPEMVNKSLPSYMAGFYQAQLYNASGGGNYTDHYNMLTSQFDNMTTILYEFMERTVSLEDCRKAMLFGMNNPGEGADVKQKEFINMAYDDILNKFNFTNDQINQFFSNQVNAPSDKKTPTNCD